MRYAFGLIVAAVLGVAALSPSKSEAGPLIYRGGPWDRWVQPVYDYATGYSSGGMYYYPTYSSYYYPSGYTTYYYPSGSYYYPTTTYYYPTTTYYYPATSYYYPTYSSYYYPSMPVNYGWGRWRWR